MSIFGKEFEDILSGKKDIDFSDLLERLKYARPKNNAEQFEENAKKLEEKMLTPRGLYISIDKNNTKWVYKHTSTLLNHKDAQTKVAFGIVCAYDNKLQMALRSFNSIPGKAPQIVESRGLVAYEMNDMNLAKSTLSSTSKQQKTKFGNLAYALALISSNEYDRKGLHKLLHDSPSDLAFRILGTLAYNEEDYQSSRNYFSRAFELKKSEKNLLNILAAERRIESNWSNSEYTAAIAPYFLQMESVPKTEVIDEYIYKSSLDIPTFRLNNNLYKILKIINK